MNQTNLVVTRLFALSALAALALVPGLASADTKSSVGTYSGCKQAFSGSTLTACLQCVGNGNFYQGSSKTCGLAPGMKPSKELPKDPGPARPTAMPKSGGQYVTIPAGSFRMGAPADEEGVSDKETFEATVTITRPFMIKTTEVTHGEWQFVLNEVSPSYDKTCGQDCALGHVSWRKALEYLNALSSRESLERCYDLTGPLAVWTKGPSCGGYRLPTEAEWEYAARGGTKAPRYGELDKIAWSNNNSNGTPHPVGQKTANAFGLYDMLGSQWEWTWDVEDINAKFSGKMNDPIIGGLKQTSEGDSRSVRGGSYRSYAVYVRAAHRYQYPSRSGAVDFGFRPVRTVVAAK